MPRKKTKKKTTEEKRWIIGNPFTCYLFIIGVCLCIAGLFIQSDIISGIGHMYLSIALFYNYVIKKGYSRQADYGWQDVILIITSNFAIEYLFDVKIFPTFGFFIFLAWAMVIKIFYVVKID
ncbi:MAG: hypothetical protein K8S27_05645 [Candidatus Omnitrophica bacterium]|nr:hypothetical protein [Candidatus Omnitrophota bacterium]